MAKKLIKIRVKDGKVKLHLKNLAPNVLKAVKKEMGIQSRSLATYIIQNHLTGGTTSTSVAVRSGQMRRTTRALPVNDARGRIRGGVGFGAKYAGVHVGEKGKVTTIRPRKAKALAIPILFGLTAAGVSKVKSPRDVPDLVYLQKKGKSPILAKIIGKSIQPWFVLVKQVRIKARIHPEEILKKRSRFIAAGFLRALEEAKEST